MYVCVYASQKYRFSSRRKQQPIQNENMQVLDESLTETFRSRKGRVHIYTYINR